MQILGLQPRISKKNSQSLEQFLLTVGQNIFLVLTCCDFFSSIYIFFPQTSFLIDQFEKLIFGLPPRGYKFFFNTISILQKKFPNSKLEHCINKIPICTKGASFFSQYQSHRNSIPLDYMVYIPWYFVTEIVLTFHSSNKLFY